MNDLKELKVERMVSGGLGLARLEGRALLLAGALPGEMVLAETSSAPGGSLRGRVVRVLDPSPFRAEPDCPLAGRCGGCDFLHVRPEAALELKGRAALGEMADRYGLELEFIEAPRRERYRIRATLHLAPAPGGRPALGFYDSRRGLVEFDDCRLLDPGLGPRLAALKAWAATGAVGTGEAEVGLIKDVAGDEVLATLGSGAPSGSGLPAELAGPRRVRAAVWPRWELTLWVGPGGFTQVHPEVNRLMVEKITELAAPWAGPGARALDLYCGLGNIALPLLKSGFAVTGVERSPTGAAAARENGRGLKGFTLLRQDSARAAADLARQGRSFPVAVLDPPRAGARDLAPAVAALKAELIIYVACQPAVLGRDLPAFASLGYSLKRLICLDMFPRTSHHESIAVFSL